jgi:hypothetical protein
MYKVFVVFEHSENNDDFGLKKKLQKIWTIVNLIKIIFCQNCNLLSNTEPDVNHERIISKILYSLTITFSDHFELKSFFIQYEWVLFHSQIRKYRIILIKHAIMKSLILQLNNYPSKPQNRLNSLKNGYLTFSIIFQ